jgi:hypothetical protein
VAERGPARILNNEEAFAYWYNNGQRRTYQEVADRFGVAYNTVRKYADEHDWDGRADALDAKVREQMDKRLAALVARQRVREVEAIAALEARFFRRLLPRDEHGNPNPAEIRPEDITIRDFEALARLFELKVGGATERIGREADTSISALEEMERQIALLDERERLEGGSSGDGEG